MIQVAIRHRTFSARAGAEKRSGSLFSVALSTGVRRMRRTARAAWECSRATRLRGPPAATGRGRSEASRPTSGRGECRPPQAPIGDAPRPSRTDTPPGTGAAILVRAPESRDRAWMDDRSRPHHVSRTCVSRATFAPVEPCNTIPGALRRQPARQCHTQTLLPAMGSAPRVLGPRRCGAGPARPFTSRRALRPARIHPRGRSPLRRCMRPTPP